MSPNPQSIDEYIVLYPPEIQNILQQIRRTIQSAAPHATEAMSYKMPTFKLGGNLIHFAAFQKHIGLFPPVGGDEKLVKKASKYAGEKGNLRFPLDQPIPYDLIKQITKLRVKQIRAKRLEKTVKKPVR